VQSEKVEECRKLFRSRPSMTYLEHSSAVVRLPERDITLRVFGSPYSPDRSHQNWAFQYPDGKDESLWSTIPGHTDILVTHTPPQGHCDASEHWRDGGCQALTNALRQTKPLLHICGHCHGGRGAEVVRWSDTPGIVESTRKWDDSGAGNKKQSLLDLTGVRGGARLEHGKETAVVNASIMAKSFGRGAKEFNKPIVVDLNLPVRREREDCTETLV